ncbi:TPA: restriction endonuclease subunit S [Enterococcus faecium]
MSNDTQPEIRFPGFTEDWEQCKLLDNVAQVLDYRGKSPTKFGMEWGTEGYLVLSALNVKNGYIDKSVEAKYGNQELFERWMGLNRLKKGDVLLTTEAPLGNVAQVPDDSGYILNQRTVAFKTSENTDNNFFAQLLRSPIVQNTLIANSSGGTAKGIGMKEFAKLRANVPSKIEEQKKIGQFFKQLDDTIALHQRKLDLLKETKKGFLQKMFPKNGAKVPEIRFPGFTEDWEQRKLINYTKLITKGTTPKDKTGSGKVNFVKVENLSDGKILPIQKITEEEHEGYLKRSRLEEGDILFSIAGTLGRTAIVNKSILPANTNQALAIIRSYDFDKYFLVTTLTGHVVAEYIRKNPTVGAQPNLSLEQVGQLIINTPIKGEQKKIGNFFKQLDDTITLHQRKLDLLKEMKKGFLQKMFV